MGGTAVGVISLRPATCRPTSGTHPCACHTIYEFIIFSLLHYSARTQLAVLKTSFITSAAISHSFIYLFIIFFVFSFVFFFLFLERLTFFTPCAYTAVIYLVALFLYFHFSPLFRSCLNCLQFLSVAVGAACFIMKADDDDGIGQINSCFIFQLVLIFILLLL